MIDAVRERHSVRKYTGEPLSEEHLNTLRAEVAKVNVEAGLDVRIVTDDPKAFSGVVAKIAGFSNVPAYIAMCGRDTPDLPEKVGYYGERIVLLAQTLGLRTCWAMVCSRKHVEALLPEGEVMVIGIALGRGAEEGKPHKNRDTDDVADMGDAPLWFMNGVESALLAPTAMNKQDFHLSHDGAKVRVTGKSGKMSQIDVGIVKLHFEIGAGKDRFEWA